VKEQIEARLKLGQEALAKEKPPVPTVEEYWETFKKNYVDSALRKSTAASYASNFKTHINPTLGALPLDEVVPADIEAFIANLVTVKKKAKATIATIIKELCKLFNHARKHKIVTENPASGVSELYRQAKTIHEEIQPLTAKEVPILLAAAKQYYANYYELFLCAIHTGLRSAELAGLQWSDIDFHGKFLIVRRSVVRGRIEKRQVRIAAWMCRTH
jgi:integrase